MGDDFGLQFNPTASMNRQAGSGASDPNEGVQEAIRTLSLRVPRISGAQGFSPLFNAAGSQGVATPGGMSLDQLLMQIFGGKRPQGQGQPGMGQPGMGQPGMGASFAPSFQAGLVGEGGTPIPGEVAPPDPDITPTPLPQPFQAPTRSPRMAQKYLSDTPLNGGGGY